ncbi:MAG TPA: dihydrofolate reductase family protein [Candidatus Omnitrophota bacterium]|nr:dihydrofolate reductase family protein [Candidatus Omnitrophota bacterium]HQO58744.1 dihydrofolate reductase family protein [Candidatus Omnitrophota bacterium]
MAKDNKIKVIMHDSVSLDGSFVNFAYTQELMTLHYQIAAGFGRSLRLFGSSMANVAIEMFGGFTPETPEDRRKPAKPEGLAYWVVVDSRAALINKLHYFRRSEYCRDMVVLVSEATSAGYLTYLREREYDYFVVGAERVDLGQALKLITEKYGVDTVLTDSGRELTNVMLNQGLVDEVSLLICPMIVGVNAENLFSKVASPRPLVNVREAMYPGGYIHVHGEVKK